MPPSLGADARSDAIQEANSPRRAIRARARRDPPEPAVRAERQGPIRPIPLGWSPCARGRWHPGSRAHHCTCTRQVSTEAVSRISRTPLVRNQPDLYITLAGERGFEPLMADPDYSFLVAPPEIAGAPPGREAALTSGRRGLSPRPLGRSTVSPPPPGPAPRAC